MESKLKQLQAKFPNLQFREGRVFLWSPETREIVYRARGRGVSATWSLLHETSHALLGHTTYGTDFELVTLEMQAWEKAKELAAELDVAIDEDHIQDCLDSYRDWIYARSMCPRCGTRSVQQSDLKQYQCYNCHEIWQVTPSRFCRAYRATKHAKSSSVHQFDALASI